MTTRTLPSEQHGLARPVVGRGVVVFLAFLATACADAAVQGSTPVASSEAVRALEQAWRHTHTRLLLDEVRFYHELSPQKHLWENGFEPLAAYARYQAYVKAGVLRINRDRDLTTGNFNFNDFFALTQNGIRRLVHIALTEKGVKRLGDVSATLPNGRRRVLFRVATSRIENVISEESLEINSERFQLVLGTLAVDLVPEFKDAWIESGGETYRERRFRALLKHDPFATDDALRWRLYTGDIAPLMNDFMTRNVPTTIANLRAGGAR